MAENQSIRATESDNWIGYGKGNEMVGVIQSVFGYNLSNYAYLSHGELWDKGRGEVAPEFKALFGLVTDLFVNAQEGENWRDSIPPLGRPCSSPWSGRTCRSKRKIKIFEKISNQASKIASLFRYYG